MYDPTTVRFLSKDPLEELGGSPNLYLYCANDPVNKTDPSGNTSTQDKILGVLGIDPAGVRKLNECQFKWPEFSCWRTNWDRVKGCGAFLEQYTFSQFKLDALKKDPKPLVWVLADVTHIDPKLLSALADLFGNFNRDGLSRVALAFLGYESWDDILGEFLAHAGTDHVADLVQLINLFAVGQNGRPALLNLDVGAGFVRLFELFTRDPDVLKDLLAQLPDALKAFQKAAGEEILEYTLGAVLSTLLQGGISAIPIIGPLFKLIQYVLNNAGRLCDLAHTGSEFLQGLIDTGRAGDQFGTQCAALLPKLHALVRKLLAAVITSVLSVLGAQRAVTRLGEVLTGLQKVARKPFEVVLRLVAKLAGKIADANRRGILGQNRDPMAPEPLSPDAGVFSDPDVQAGAGAWHVWVGENADDLWVRVNPTANLSANVRKAEPGKACNVPAKAEMRTGANGLKAVKIGRGQRFTRGQAQQVPKDNHKVVAGSARAAEQELGCVPKCRKCAVLPPTATCKVKGGGQCFVGETPVRWSGASGFELQALAQVCLGERVETFRSSDGSWWEPGARRLFAASQDRAVWLRQERGDGGWTAVGLIRSRIWLEKQGASRVGARVELKLPEMGASGPFEVVSVEPCPAICAGAGCVVTGVICHGAGRVFDLWLESESGPLGVTAGHPIWSADRGAWVPAGALQVGECVQGVAGPVRVLRMEKRGDEPVFTLEVDGDHCFRVGEQGILVHNASAGCTPCEAVKLPKTGIKSVRHVVNSTRLVQVFDDRAAKRSVTSGQYISQHAVETAFAHLLPEDLVGKPSPTGDPETEWTQCVVGVKLDQAGHVIANSLGGSGKLDDQNLFPINSTFNQGRQSGFEKRVKALVVPGKEVCLAAFFDYKNSDPDYPARPSSVVYRVYVDGIEADMLAYENVFPPNPFDPVPNRPNLCGSAYWEERKQKEKAARLKRKQAPSMPAGNPVVVPPPAS